MDIKKVINIEGMSCSHCVKAVTDAVKPLKGVKSVEVSLEKKQADVEYDDTLLSLETIKAAIEDQGYDVV